MTKFRLKSLIIVGMLAVLGVGVLGCTNTLPDDDGLVLDDGKDILVNDGGQSVSDIDVSDWETYTSKSYGYEIRYPTNWNEKGYSFHEYGDIVDLIYFTFGVYAGDECNPNKLDIQEWLQSRDINDRTNFIFIDDVKAVTNADDLKSYNPSVIIDFALGDRIFEIKWSDDGQVREQEYQYFLKILDTINFDGYEDSYMIDKEGRLVNFLCGEELSDYQKRLGFNVKVPHKYILRLHVYNGGSYDGIYIRPEDSQEATPIIIPIRGSLEDALEWLKKEDSYVNYFTGSSDILVKQEDSVFKGYLSKKLSLFFDNYNGPGDLKEWAILEAVENKKTNVTFLLLNEMPDNISLEEDVVLGGFELLD